NWPSGFAPLGYGDPVTTTINFGPDANNKYITYYFRRKFTVVDPSKYRNVLARIRRDDGVVAYINGTEVLRSNMPQGPITYQTFAATALGGSDETTFFPFTFPATVLQAGENVMAIELHQVSASSSDAELDVELSANQSPIVSIAGPVDGAVITGP